MYGSSLIDHSEYPSAYIAISTILARDQCGLVGSAFNSSTTIAFNQSDISTAISFDWGSLSYSWVPDIFTDPVFTAFEWQAK